MDPYTWFYSLTPSRAKRVKALVTILLRNQLSHSIDQALGQVMEAYLRRESQTPTTSYR